MDFARLCLALAPTLASRTPSSGSLQRGHGFMLRLVDGPAIERDDPWLRAFAAEKVERYGEPRLHEHRRPLRFRDERVRSMTHRVNVTVFASEPGPDGRVRSSR